MPRVRQRHVVAEQQRGADHLSHLQSAPVPELRDGMPRPLLRRNVLLDLLDRGPSTGPTRERSRGFGVQERLVALRIAQALQRVPLQARPVQRDADERLLVRLRRRGRRVPLLAKQGRATRLAGCQQTKETEINASLGFIRRASPYCSRLLYPLPPLCVGGEPLATAKRAIPCGHRRPPRPGVLFRRGQPCPSDCCRFLVVVRTRRSRLPKIAAWQLVPAAPCERRFGGVGRAAPLP